MYIYIYIYIYYIYLYKIWVRRFAASGGSEGLDCSQDGPRNAKNARPNFDAFAARLRGGPGALWPPFWDNFGANLETNLVARRTAGMDASKM